MTSRENGHLGVFQRATMRIHFERTVLCSPPVCFRPLDLSFVFSIRFITNQDYYEIWARQCPSVCQPSWEAQERRSTDSPISEERGTAVVCSLSDVINKYCSCCTAIIAAGDGAKKTSLVQMIAERLYLLPLPKSLLSGGIPKLKCTLA